MPSRFFFFRFSSIWRYSLLGSKRFQQKDGSSASRGPCHQVHQLQVPILVRPETQVLAIALQEVEYIEPVAMARRDDEGAMNASNLLKWGGKGDEQPFLLVPSTPYFFAP